MSYLFKQNKLILDISLRSKLTDYYQVEKQNRIEENNKSRMAASNLCPVFAYTVIYVTDVAKSVAFYAKAFDYTVRTLDHSHRCIYLIIQNIIIISVN